MLFGQIVSKNSISFTEDEIWYLDKFGYRKFDGDAHLFFVRLVLPFLDKFGPKTQKSLF